MKTLKAFTLEEYKIIDTIEPLIEELEQYGAVRVLVFVYAESCNTGCGFSEWSWSGGKLVFNNGKKERVAIDSSQILQAVQYKYHGSYYYKYAMELPNNTKIEITICGQ